MYCNIDRYINFITENGLTQSQFTMLYLIARKRSDLISKYKEAFPTGDGTMIGSSLKRDLIDRGFIIKCKDGETQDCYELGQNFLNIYLDEYECGNEILEIYPSFMTIKGLSVPLITMDRYEFRQIYATRIGFDRTEHYEVVKDLKFAIEKNIIRFGIEKFVRAEMWKEIRKLRLSTALVVEGKETDNEF